MKLVAGVAVLGLICLGTANADARSARWAGFYVGGNAGYGWAETYTDIRYPRFTFTFRDFPQSAFFPESSFGSFFGGVQAGFNVPFGNNWVFGLETDFQKSFQRGTTTTDAPFAWDSSRVGGSGIDIKGNTSLQLQTSISWFGTVRGRLGYDWDGLLVYGTGGFAYGDVRAAGSASRSGDIEDCFPGCGIVASLRDKRIQFESSEINPGWTLGLGIESLLGDLWSWKAEYLYVDLGKIEITGPVTGYTVFTNHVVRFGLNYHL